MKRKIKIRLIVIVPLLVVFAVGAWSGTNLIVARQLSLVEAVEIGDFDAVKYICRWDPEQLDKTGRSGSVQAHALKGLIRNRKDWRRASTSGIDWRARAVDCTALELACVTGDERIVEHLLRCGANAMLTTNGKQTCLHVAAENGYTNVVQLLVDAGATVNVKNDRNLSPLRLACYGDHASTVRVLAKAGADVDAAEKGRSALQWAAMRGKTETARALVECGAAITPEKNGTHPIVDAVMGNHVLIIELLLDAGADPNSTDIVPLLHLAAGCVHKDAAKTLIKAGANVNAVSDSEETALDYIGSLIMYVNRGGISSLETAPDPSPSSTGTEVEKLLRKYGGKTSKELKKQYKVQPAKPE